MPNSYYDKSKTERGIAAFFGISKIFMANDGMQVVRMI
jgi:hypothetical protein